MQISQSNNTIKVVMIVPTLPPLPAGGAEIQALRLGSELTKHNVQVFFITPGKGSLKGKAFVEGLQVYWLNSIFNKIFDFISRLKKSSLKVSHEQIEYNDQREVTNEITRQVKWPTIIYYTIFYWHALFFLWKKRSSIDIIHAHTMEWSAIVAAKLGKRLKKGVIIKDSTMNGFKSLERFPSGKKRQQFVISQAYFIAMTRAIERNLLNQGVPAEKITRIPNGIIIPNEPFTTVKTKNDKKVLFVGNLYQQPAKGIDILLKAWGMVVKKVPGSRLIIAGDGNIRAYEEYVKKLGINDSVDFLGKQGNLKALYADSSIFVLPSRREGMSNALMEAMVYALPCIATDISGNQDLIDDSTSGLLVPVADAVKLADRMVYLLQNPEVAVEMGRNAYAKIKQVADMPIVVEMYIKLYKKMIE